MSVFGFLRERVDLAELAGRHTDLRPSGRALVGRCPRPDHEDRTPSFHVYPDRRFRCYGCGWHGDVTDFWAGVNGMKPGIEAALGLARQFGIEPPDVEPEAQGLAEARRRKEAEYLEQAEEHYEALLRHPRATAWWEGRGFDEGLRERFLLGATRDGSTATVPFWNGGRVQGLIQRSLEEYPGRKYLLPKKEEFPAGHRPLFVPERVKDGTFLVEGYVDALALVALGYSAVAVGGTHISERQLDELRRIPGHIYVLPDADEEGLKAGRRWAGDLFPKALLCQANYQKEETKDD